MSARFRAIYARRRTLTMGGRIGVVAAASILLLEGCAVWKEGRITPLGEDATRSLTLEVEPLRQGGRFLKARVGGAVSSADPGCVASHEVIIESRRVGRDRWVAIGSQLTDGGGSYSMKLDVHRDEELRAVVSRFRYCRPATSPIMGVGG